MKTVDEEHFSSEYVPTFHCSLIIMKQLYLYDQETKQSQQTIKQTKVVQEVVSPEVSKLIYYVMNEKQGDKIQSSPEKKIKEKGFITLVQPIILVDGLCYLCYLFINSTRSISSVKKGLL